MALIPLAARHSIVDVQKCVVPEPQRPPTSLEWEARYQELQQLYLRERRKLRHIAHHMKLQYGFNASLQMYKRRFAEWGFRKSKPSKPRNNGSVRDSSTVSTASTPSAAAGSPANSNRERVTGRHMFAIAKPMVFSSQDFLQLTVLTNVQAWTMAFFDSWRENPASYTNSLVGPSELSWAMSINMSINSAFKVINNLLQRGHGDLAGRVTRKAFLLLEDMLTLDAPALLWNLMEIMYFLVRLGHLRIFVMLLAHLTELVDSRMPEANPLASVLYGLRGHLFLVLKENNQNLGDISGTGCLLPSPAPSSEPPLDDGNGKAASGHRNPLTRQLLDTLEKAWVLNADMVMKSFHPDLFALYMTFYAKHCSISPPRSINSVATKWFDNFEKVESADDIETVTQTLEDVTDVEKMGVWKFCRSSSDDVSPPLNLGVIRSQTTSALRKHAGILFQTDVCGKGEVLSTQVLAQLLCSKVIDELPQMESCATDEEALTMARLYAIHLTCALSTMLDINLENPIVHMSSDQLVANVKNLLLLREYSYGHVHPDTLGDLWLLEETLRKANKPREAQEVRLEALRRVEEYVADIPTNVP